MKMEMLMRAGQIEKYLNQNFIVRRAEESVKIIETFQLLFTSENRKLNSRSHQS